MNPKQKKLLTRIIVALVLFVAIEVAAQTGVLAAAFGTPGDVYAEFALFLIPYLIAGYDVIAGALRGLVHGHALDEDFLMTVATFGAFALVLFPDTEPHMAEGAAVMLFFQVGELFQSYAVDKSRQSIADMMDIAPEYANVMEEGKLKQVDPFELAPDDEFIVMPGERIPLDGTVLTGESQIDTAALTGESVPRTARPGDEVISGKLGTTLYMAVLSLLLSMPIGILLGTVTAVKRGQWADTIITLFSNLLIAIPQFVTAILFLYYISMKWKLLPPQGFTWPWVDFHKHIQQLIMPLTCLTLCGIAGFCRQTRSSVLEVLGQDYVRTARAKGLKETRILWKHVMNNGLIPILTMIGGRLASLIGGSIFVENVFNIPGMGNLMVKAVNTMDIPVIQALVLITAAVISVAYIITDLLYVAVDPRISLS